MAISAEQQQWIAISLEHPVEALSVTLIAGDASPRRYYRVALTASQSWAESVIFVSSPATENNDAFLAIQALLSAQGVRVPAVLRSDLTKGWFLLEDFGDTLLADCLSPETVDSLYEQALAVLKNIQAPSADWQQVSSYDANRLQQELDVFSEWFVQGLLSLTQESMHDSGYSALCVELINSALVQPQVLVHRDFHCRNVMRLGDGTLGVIDFQDAVIGPVTYDAVSLLKDCYVVWPRERQLEWLASYVRAVGPSQGSHPIGMDQWVRWFDLMGLQRHLKVLGVFSRLALRDGKAGYLDDIPRVMDYVREVLGLYAGDTVMRHFDDWWQRVIEPATADWQSLVDGMRNQS